MGAREIERSLEQWQMNAPDLRRRMILAPTPRERERWYAMLLLAQGWKQRRRRVSAGVGRAVAAPARRVRHGRTLGKRVATSTIPSQSFSAQWSTVIKSASSLTPFPRERCPGDASTSTRVKTARRPPNRRFSRFSRRPARNRISRMRFKAPVFSQPTRKPPPSGP